MNDDKAVEKLARAIDGVWAVGGSAEEAAQAAIEAHLKALEEAGYVVVPAEPTKEMIYAGDTVSMDAGDIWDPSGGCNHSGPQCGREVWQAMISAAKGVKP